MTKLRSTKKFEIVLDSNKLKWFYMSCAAAYRIRTYDVLIRSQTLYPAEVTPRLVDYYAHGLNNRQAFFKKSY